MIIKNKFNLEQRVYLITDPEQNKGIIVGINADVNGHVYIVKIGTEKYECFEAELSKTKNKLIGSEKDDEED